MIIDVSVYNYSNLDSINLERITLQSLSMDMQFPFQIGRVLIWEEPLSDPKSLHEHPSRNKGDTHCGRYN